LHTALFVNGTEKVNIHKYETFLNQNNSQSGVVSGIITITTAGLPAELDIRVRHDNGGSVNFTGVYGNLSVVKIGEY
jgi:hypothetical protein